MKNTHHNCNISPEHAIGGLAVKHWLIITTRQMAFTWVIKVIKSFHRNISLLAAAQQHGSIRGNYSSYCFVELIFDIQTFSDVLSVSESYFFCVKMMLKTAWDRLLVSFMLVAATVLKKMAKFCFRGYIYP